MEIGALEWKKLIIEGANDLDIHIDAETADLFAIHGIELIRWGAKTNLTAITDPYEIAVKHFIDSIAAVPFIPPNSSVLDVGSGGGFPGLPLKAARPDLHLTLIDSIRKKISFLNHVIRRLDFQQIETIQIRVEELAKQNTALKKYDVVMCRAFSDLTGFIKKALPLMSTDGELILYRGVTTQADIQSLHSFALPYKIHPYRLPYLNAERSLIILG
jgi:16S rRNA (guanine527-N7)-methyltransferase